MRDFEKKLEEKFFDIVSPFYNLETAPVRAYSEEEYSLKRLQPLVDLFDNPENKLKVCHIAGTKGKGTTSYFLTNLLLSAGKSVGTFTSPHVATVRERFQINGELIDYDFLLMKTEEICQKILSSDIARPSLFELMTVMACIIFAEKGCEYAILETGIGGRLDATNYIAKPLVCGITSISFDHQELLGETIAEIAAEKGGIIKSQVPIICGKQTFAETKEVLSKIAKSLNAPFLQADIDSSIIEKYQLEDLPEFLKENFSLAWEMASIAKVNPNPDTFQMPQLRARFEIVQDSPPVILDAAHNRDSANRLTQALKKRFPEMKYQVILGIVPGKDYIGIIDELEPIIDHVLIVDPKTTKGSRGTEIDDYLEQKQISHSYIGTIAKEILPPNKPILFTGSFYTAVLGEELYW